METFRTAVHAKLVRLGKRDTQERTVIVASNYELCRQSHVQRLAIATVERKIPRRRLIDWIATVVANYEGRIIWATGVEFEFGEMAIYEAFAVEKDPSQRWVGNFYKFSVHPPIQVAQSRIIDRLRYIDLAFRIDFPERAEIIAK